MNWKKLGQIYSITEDMPQKYGMHPVVEVLDEKAGLIRIYYTARDEQNTGFLRFMEGIVDNEKFTETFHCRKALFRKGDLGNFDDSGVCVCSMVKLKNGVRRFYYYGWNLGVTVPFRNAVGVAEAVGDGEDMRIKRVFPGAIMDRNMHFPGLCATPFVLAEDGFFRMYFAQGTPWKIKDGEPSVACNIGYAESDDGLHWIRSMQPSVANQNDHVVTTPMVYKENGIYKMFYSWRGEKYRLGYAESLDGQHFVRKDHMVGITVSETGWDSEMVEYPAVFTVKGKRYMIYCGNKYARYGFGLAVLEDDSV